MSESGEALVTNSSRSLGILGRWHLVRCGKDIAVLFGFSVTLVAWMFMSLLTWCNVPSRELPSARVLHHEETVVSGKPRTQRQRCLGSLSETPLFQPDDYRSHRADWVVGPESTDLPSQELGSTTFSSLPSGHSLPLALHRIHHTGMETFLERKPGIPTKNAFLVCVGRWDSLNILLSPMGHGLD